MKHVEGQEVELKMTRQEIVMPTVMGYRRDSGNNWDYWVSAGSKVAYVRVTQFTADTFKELHKSLDKVMGEGMKGLILDLRFNPGGRLDQAKQVVNLFVNDGVIVVTKGLHRTEEIARARPEDALPRQFPMIVLVNEHSASRRAEIVAGSLKDNRRALIMGTRTYGKGSVQEIIPLEPDEGELKLTVAYYYLPSGRLVHKKKGATDWGVDPNVSVPVTEKAEAQVYQDQGRAGTLPQAAASCDQDRDHPDDPQWSGDPAGCGCAASGKRPGHDCGIDQVERRQTADPGHPASHGGQSRKRR